MKSPFHDKKFRLAMIHAGLISSLEQAILMLLVEYKAKFTDDAPFIEIKERIMSMIESSTALVEDQQK